MAFTARGTLAQRAVPSTIDWWAGAPERSGRPGGSTGPGSYVPAPVRLKWPNDLMHDGRKAGWHSVRGAMAGSSSGLDCSGCRTQCSKPGAGRAPGDGSLSGGVGPEIQLETVLHSVAAAIRGLDLGAERLSPAELELFAARSWLDGREIREPLAGIVAGLDDDGALRVRTPQGSRRVPASRLGGAGGRFSHR